MTFYLKSLFLLQNLYIIKVDRESVMQAEEAMPSPTNRMKRCVYNDKKFLQSETSWIFNRNNIVWNK